LFGLELDVSLEIGVWDLKLFRRCSAKLLWYYRNGFGKAENRFRREPGEESPNTAGRDAA